MLKWMDLSWFKDEIDKFNSNFFESKILGYLIRWGLL